MALSGKPSKVKSLLQQSHPNRKARRSKACHNNVNPFTPANINRKSRKYYEAAEPEWNRGHMDISKENTAAQYTEESYRAAVLCHMLKRVHETSFFFFQHMDHIR